MKNRIVIAAALSASLLGTSAFAQLPASGEGPLFQNEVAASSVNSRDVVRAEAAQKSAASLTPRRHESDASTLMALHPVAKESRAEVRAQTREAIAHGIKPSTGEAS